MIQLYKRGNNDFEHNGDFILKPESCILEQKINDTWIVTLQYAYEDSDTFKNIINDAVLAVPTPDSDKQLFRIYNTIKDISGKTAYARPIFLDAAKDTMLLDVRPTNATGQEALDKITKGTIYKATSDIVDINTAYYVRKNIVEAIASDDENSFLNRWGGEIFYDNYSVLVNKRLGRDRGVRAVFGRNLREIEENISFDGTYTRIIPIAYNGYTLAGSSPWVDSPLINNYANIRYAVINYDDIKLQEDCGEGENGYANKTELRAALRTACKNEFENGIDKPTVNYVVDIVDLSQTIEYKDYQILETVHLGDTVMCRHKMLDIDVSARAVSITYDCINKKNNSIELGDATGNFLNDMSSNIQSIKSRLDGLNIDADGNFKGECISGTIDLMKTKIKASHEVAKPQIERAILFEDNDISSPTYGAMSLGTTGFAIASSKNVSGDWIWSTFGTGEGFLADCIIGGVLYSQNYKEGKQGCKFDLNKGLINAYNLAWKAANSSMTPDGSLTVKDVTIDGGSFNINDNFIVTKDGKLSWKASGSSMTSAGKMSCSDFSMTGGTINIEAEGKEISKIILKYKDTEIDIRPKGIMITSDNYETLCNDGVISVYNKNTKKITNIDGGNLSIGGDVSISANSTVSLVGSRIYEGKIVVEQQDGSRIQLNVKKGLITY